MSGARRFRALCCAATASLVVLLPAILGSGVQAAPSFHPSTKVVLFTPAASDPLVARLEAELAAVGIQVRKVNMPPDGQLDAAVSREIAAGASAAIRVIPRSRGADVWTGETTARMLRRRSSGSDTSDLSVIALRTVEFLRATLLDVKKRPPTGASGGAASGTVGKPAAETAIRETSAGAGTAASAGTERPGAMERSPTTPAASEGSPARGTEVPSPSRTAETAPARNTEPVSRVAEAPPPVRPGEAGGPAEPPPAAKPARLPEWGLAAPAELTSPSEPLYLEISAGPALIASPGAIGAITSVAVIGRGHFSEQAGIELMSVLPLSPSHLNKLEGTVAIKTALFGAAVVFHVDAPRHLRADAAVGASAVMIRAEGTGVGGVGTEPVPNVGSVQTAWKVAGHVRLGGGVNLNRWLSVRADVIGGLTARTVVGYDATDVAGKTVTTDWATWGPAFMVGMLGLQASW